MRISKALYSENFQFSQENPKLENFGMQPTYSFSTPIPVNSSSTQLTLFLEMVNHLMDIGSVNIWFKFKMGFWIDRLGDIRLNPQVAKGRTRRICCRSSCYAYRKVCTIFQNNVGNWFRKTFFHQEIVRYKNFSTKNLPHLKLSYAESKESTRKLFFQGVPH